MSRPVKEDPASYKGPREIIHMKGKCGFCSTEDHDKCAHEIPWFEKLWICSCDCNKNWVPVDVGDASMAPGGKTKKRKTKETEDEVRTVRDDGDPGFDEEDGEPRGTLRDDSGSDEGEAGMEEQPGDSDSDS